MFWKCQNVAVLDHFCKPLGISGCRHLVSVLGLYKQDEVCTRMKTTLRFGAELYFVSDVLPHHHYCCIQRSPSKERGHANVHWETETSTGEMLWFLIACYILGGSTVSARSKSCFCYWEEDHFSNRGKG